MYYFHIEIVFYRKFKLFEYELYTYFYVTNGDAVIYFGVLQKIVVLYQSLDNWFR